MDILEAISARHSVRKYIDRQISADVQAQLRAEIAACNAQGDLNIQLATDEPEAFHGLMARYGKFVNVTNYLALVGKKSKTLDESIGYYGEKIVLKATTLGLDSCWVALTYQKGKCTCTIAPGETLRCVIALGYGRDHGVPHRSKPMEALCKADGSIPEWFRCGMQAALLAPTATNQQKFMFTLSGSQVHAQATGGFYPQIDLGIVKYHFELGAGAGNFKWA